MHDQQEIETRLKGKRVLLLSVRYFDYENAIARQIRSCGAEVSFYDERPANSVFAKGMIRVKKSVYQTLINSYYRKILHEITTHHYDYLLVIRGEVVPTFFLAQFKQQNPNAYLIYYTWDSFKNNAHPLSILHFFDEKFTFDSQDAKRYNLKFRCLFFMDQYAQLEDQSSTKTYSLLFLGTAHSDRYRISQQLVSWCSQNKLPTFTYYYCQSRFVYLYKKWFDPSFKSFTYSDLSFKPLKTEEIIDLYRKSSVILDINHPAQSGLTMRTFEALGARKKLMTTNPQILNYPFYNENNILLIDREEPLKGVTLNFFNTPFIPLNPAMQVELSLSGWIHALFSRNGGIT